MAQIIVKSCNTSFRSILRIKILFCSDLIDLIEKKFKNRIRKKNHDFIQSWNKFIVNLLRKISKNQKFSTYSHERKENVFGHMVFLNSLVLSVI